MFCLISRLHTDYTNIKVVVELVSCVFREYLPGQQVAVEPRRLEANCRKVEETQKKEATAAEATDDSVLLYRCRARFGNTFSFFFNFMVSSILSNTFSICFASRLLDLHHELAIDNVDTS